MQVKLKNTEWEIGSVLGTGGFGSVFEAASPNGDLAAAKFIPKGPGAKREMLFEDSLADVRNVVPILDTGEDDDHWIIIMPRASHSLRDALEKGPLGLDDARRVLEDVADALADLKGRGIVHRDLKPENVLWLEGTWRLADFGISRYAEAATAASTNKGSWTHPYAAPEQWRHERATSATDIYALGVMGFELLNGSRPFTGNSSELREAHLHNPVPPSNAPKKLGWLIEECLEKSPEARPSPADFRRRLDLSLKGESAAGLLALQNANQAQTQKRAEIARQNSLATTDAERRAALTNSAENSFERISKEVLETLLDSAPAATVVRGEYSDWVLLLGHAKLALNRPLRAFSGRGIPSVSWGAKPAPFEVVSAATIKLTCGNPVRGYKGRSHSLWYGDVENESQFAWYETAFMDSVWKATPWAVQPYESPYGISPTDKAALALTTSTATQIAWPFMGLDILDLSEFVDRWAAWFASASEGSLQAPSQQPERPPSGSWRA